jgi:predicted house-cleaning noncanonical NTP pyrophosphatase (MazG superfamily)
MSRVYYNKLIRDAIPEKIKENGETCEVRVIEDGQEFEQELLKKVMEEAQGLSKTRSREAFLSEYADLAVVLDALTKTLEFSEADIKLAIEENVKEKGRFDKRLFLNWSSDEGYKSSESPQGISNSNL